MESTFRLKKPILIGFNIDGIEREEAITHVTVAVVPDAPDREQIALAYELHGRIDHSRVEPFAPEDLFKYNIRAGIREAQDAAIIRARLYCAAKAAQLAGEAAETRFQALGPYPVEALYYVPSI